MKGSHPENQAPEDVSGEGPSGEVGHDSAHRPVSELPAAQSYQTLLTSFTELRRDSPQVQAITCLVLISLVLEVQVSLVPVVCSTEI